MNNWTRAIALWLPWLRSLWILTRIYKLRNYQQELTLEIESWCGTKHTILFLPYEENMLKWLRAGLWKSRFVIRSWGHPDPEDGEEVTAFAEQEVRLRSSEQHTLDPPTTPEAIFRARLALRPNPVEEIICWDGKEGALLTDVAYIDGRNMVWILMPQLSSKMKQAIKTRLRDERVLVRGYFPFDKKNAEHRRVLGLWIDFWHGQGRHNPGGEPLPPLIERGWLGMLPTWATNEIKPQEDSGDKTFLDVNRDPIPRVIPTPPPNGYARPIKIRDMETPFRPGEARHAQAYRPIGTGRTGETAQLRSLPLRCPKCWEGIPEANAQFCPSCGSRLNKDS